MSLERKLSLPTGIFSVIASMIGTGIFVTTGTILGEIGSPWIVLTLWVIGGIVALAGSFCYAELASMYPRAGGEYTYLKETFGLLPAFMSGWVSLLVGFSASIALSTMAFNQYLLPILESFYGMESDVLFGPFFMSISISQIIGMIVVVILGGVHIIGVQFGSIIQNIFTVFKIGVVLLFILLGFYYINWNNIGQLFTSNPLIKNTSNTWISLYGIPLLIIMFCYSGYNSVTYIAEEIKKPDVNLKRSLFWGNIITLIFYILLNAIFLIAVPISVIAGKEPVASIVAHSLFPNESTSIIFNICILIILLSSISVQLMIGPRVYYAMAKDQILFKSFSHVSKKLKTPHLAIIMQMTIVIIYILLDSKIQDLMTYMGFALSIFPVLTVLGLFYLRIKYPNMKRPYRVPFYPFTPLIFLFFSISMMLAALIAWNISSLIAVLVVIISIPIYYVWKYFYQKKLQ